MADDGNPPNVPAQPSALLNLILNSYGASSPFSDQTVDSLALPNGKSFSIAHEENPTQDVANKSTVSTNYTSPDRVTVSTTRDTSGAIVADTVSIPTPSGALQLVMSQGKAEFMQATHTTFLNVPKIMNPLQFKAAAAQQPFFKQHPHLLHEILAIADEYKYHSTAAMAAAKPQYNADVTTVEIITDGKDVHIAEINASGVMYDKGIFHNPNSVADQVKNVFVDSIDKFTDEAIPSNPSLKAISTQLLEQLKKEAPHAHYSVQHVSEVEFNNSYGTTEKVADSDSRKR